MRIIKVCGMRNAENIKEVEQLGISMMGFIFWEKSSRYVAHLPSYLPSCARTGVFVNASIEEILQKTRDFGLSYIQLHGNESPQYCQELHHRLKENDLGHAGLIKAFSIAQKEDFTATEAYLSLCRYLLFDTKSTLPGGSGTQFDWELLKYYKGHLPFLLSGGIRPEDARLIRSLHHPQCIGVDLNSRFENAPAVKNTALLKKFIEEMNQQHP